MTMSGSSHNNSSKLKILHKIAQQFASLREKVSGSKMVNS